MALAVTVNQRSRQPLALRRGLSCVVVLLLGLQLLGCSPRSRTLREWSEAFVAARADQAACRQLVAPELDYICGNSAQLSSLELTPQGEYLGLSYTVADERHAARYDTIAVRLVQGKAVTLSSPWKPLWLVEPIQILHVPGAVIVAGQGRMGLPALSAAVARAVQRVHQVSLGPLIVDPGTVVIQAPSQGWAALVPPGAATSTTAAFAWPFGSDDQAGVHVLVPNSAAPDQLDTVLSHEMTHVVTRSFTWKTGWITEGVAEYVAHPDDPTTMAALVQRLATSMPTQLPSDAEIHAAQDLVAYAQARIAVVAVLEAYGPERGWQQLAAWSRGEPVPDEVTMVYREALVRYR